ncbi:MAG TPA: response regulator transcription factor [Anaerolineales bacterium]|nr:response regulator transcription factor [Anaerolineales bacterium]
MAGELVLLVDDEPSITQLCQMYLEQEGYRIEAVGDGKAALDAVHKLNPALIVLDLMLPGMDGFEVCRRLRAEGSSVLVLMLTARDEDIDKIVGLELGADDYLTKPFNPRELVARVRALLRRAGGAKELDASEVFHIGNLSIDTARREVLVEGEQVELRTQEFDLLLAFARHQRMVLSREQLLNLAWGYEYFGQTRTVDVHVAHLRKKLSGAAAQIETVTGVGYKLVV